MTQQTICNNCKIPITDLRFTIRITRESVPVIDFEADYHSIPCMTTNLVTVGMATGDI